MKLIVNENEQKYNDGDMFETEQKRTGHRYWQYHKGQSDEELDYDPNEGVPEESKIIAYKQFLVKYNPDDPSTYQYAYENPNKPGKLIPYLYPLYINADYGYKIGKWYKAGHGDYAQRMNADGTEWKDKRGNGYRMTMEKNLSFRPGDHAGSEPSMRHRGRSDLPHHGKGDKADFDYFHSQEVFAIVELAGQRDYTEDAKKRQIGKNVKTACFDDTSQFENGYYRFKTNNAASDKEAWYIAYAMKVIRVISDDEMTDILNKSGTGLKPQLRGAPNGKDRNKFSADASLFQRRKLMNSVENESVGNLTLADLSKYMAAFFFDMRNIHLNTTGDSFYTYHAVAQDLYEHAENFYDDLMETATNLGEVTSMMNEIPSDWNGFNASTINTAATKSAILSEIEIILDKIKNVKEGYDSYIYSKLDSMSEYFDKEQYKMKQALKNSRKVNSGWKGSLISNSFEQDVDNLIRAEGARTKYINEESDGTDASEYDETEIQDIIFKLMDADRDEIMESNILDNLETRAKSVLGEDYFADNREWSYLTDALYDEIGNYAGTNINQSLIKSDKEEFKERCDECACDWEEYQEGMEYPVDESVEDVIHSSRNSVTELMNFEQILKNSDEPVGASVELSDGRAQHSYWTYDEFVNWRKAQNDNGLGVVGVQITNSRKVIKSANDYGWEVTSSQANEALELWVEYVGEEQALEDIARACGDGELGEDMEYIFRMWELGDYEDFDSAWDAYEYAKEMMGVSELLNNLTQAMGTDELSENLAFIFRQNDFQEWNRRNGSDDDDISEEDYIAEVQHRAEEHGVTLTESDAYEIKDLYEDRGGTFSDVGGMVDIDDIDMFNDVVDEYMGTGDHTGWNEDDLDF